MFFTPPVQMGKDNALPPFFLFGRQGVGLTGGGVVGRGRGGFTNDSSEGRYRFKGSPPDLLGRGPKPIR